MKTVTICDTCGNGPVFGSACTSDACSWITGDSYYKKNWKPKHESLTKAKPKKIYAWAVVEMKSKRTSYIFLSRSIARAYCKSLFQGYKVVKLEGSI